MGIGDPVSKLIEDIQKGIDFQNPRLKPEYNFQIEETPQMIKWIKPSYSGLETFITLWKDDKTIDYQGAHHFKKGLDIKNLDVKKLFELIGYNYEAST